MLVDADADAEDFQQQKRDKPWGSRCAAGIKDIMSLILLSASVCVCVYDHVRVRVQVQRRTRFFGLSATAATVTAAAAKSLAKFSVFVNQHSTCFLFCQAAGLLDLFENHIRKMKC